MGGPLPNLFIYLLTVLPKFCSFAIRIRYFNYNDIHICKPFSLFVANKRGGGILHFVLSRGVQIPRGPLSWKPCYNDFDVKIMSVLYTHEI